MSGSKKQVTTFVLEGRLLDTLGKSALKPKYMRLATAEGEQLLKISKELRPLLSQNQLEMGSWIKVSGKETYKPKKGKRSRKIKTIDSHPDLASSPQPVTVKEKGKSKEKPKKEKKENILVCQKSSCCKRGGKAVYQAAMETVEKHELRDRVQVKPTGCMGKCKKGPCLVMQADKSRHIGIKPEEVPDLIAQRYTPVAS